MKRSLRYMLAMMLTVGVVASACASSGGDTASPDATTGGSSSIIEAGWVNGTDLQPNSGGTLNVTLPAAPRGLDPNTTTLGLVTQGPILTAIYDSLLRYDPETGKMTGQLAESITPNDDFTQWTIKLRPGVTFSDGTPLDADAVIYSIDRIRSARGLAATYPSFFSAIEKIDPLTVSLKLDTPLNNVDALFAAELGYIVSPTAATAAGDGFARKPVGAGPFVVESFNPDSELILAKNPNYALGDVRLDKIRMTWSPDQGANLDKVITGQADMTFLGGVAQVARAIEEGQPTYTTLVGGNGITINNKGSAAFPGNDPRLRQALSMAIDPEVQNQRAFDGQGIVGRWMVPPGNRFHTDTPFSVGDPDRARQLVEEVKADTGWNGSVRLITTSSDQAQALAYQAQLNAAGFNVNLDLVADTSQMVEKVMVNRDFDLSIWVMTMYDTNIYQALSRSLSSTSDANYLSYRSAAMDGLLAELRAANDDAAARETLSKIGELWQSEQPFFFSGAQTFSTVTSDKVGGLVPTVQGVFLWSEIFKN